MYIFFVKMSYENSKEKIFMDQNLQEILNSPIVQNLQSLIIGYLFGVFQIYIEGGYFTHALDVMVFRDKQNFE